MMVGALVKLRSVAVNVNTGEYVGGQIGLIIGWANKKTGFAKVMWYIHGGCHVSPCHVSKIEVVSAGR